MLFINIYQKYKVQIITRWSHLNINGKFARDTIAEDFELTGTQLLEKLYEVCQNKLLESIEITASGFIFMLFNQENSEATDIYVTLEAI